MKVWFRLAIRELLNRRGFSLFFILNIALGLTGFVAVNAFKNSILDYLGQNLKEILTADVTVRSRAAFTEKEQDFIRRFFDKDSYSSSKGVQLFSMANAEEYSKLVQVVSIDDAYPLYGEIMLKKKGKSTPEIIRKHLIENPGVWIREDTLIALGLQIGDSFKLGNRSFVIDDVILNEPSVGMTNIASRVFVGDGALKDTGLLQPQTRMNFTIYLKALGNPDFADLKKDFVEAMEREFGEESNLRIHTFRDSNDRVGGLLSRMLGYLNLIAMIALLIAGVGSAYLFRDYFRSRLVQVGILLSLGARRRESYWILLIQLLILGFIASVVTLLLSLFLLPFMPFLLEGLIDVNLQFTIPWQTALAALFLGTAGSLGFCLPVMVRYENHHPVAILRNQPNAGKNPPRKHRIILSYFPALLIFWGMTSAQSSVRDASIFTGITLFALLVISLIALFMIFLGEKLSPKAPVFLKIALRNLSRRKAGTLSGFAAIALGTFLIGIIPQIYQGLYNEIKKPEGVRIPALFLFDIQEEQLPDLQNTLKEKNLELEYLSPMINARLQSVNGESPKDFFQKADQDDDDPRAFRGVRRIFRLSYRDKMIESEILVDGVTFEEYAKNHPEEDSMISMDSNFAERYGFKLGDKLQFNVQGIPIAAKIVNLRRVIWNSFQPNFFIVFNSKELKNAPKIFLANIAKDKNLNEIELQKDLVKKFPTISVINVSEALGVLLQTAEKMIFAITAIAYLSILGGLSVIFSIARSEAKNRKWEINMMKVLGASFGDIRKIIFFEFALIGFLSTLIGMGFSILLSITVSNYLLSGIWAGSWTVNLLTLFAITTVIILTTQLAVNRVVREKPWNLLK